MKKIFEKIAELDFKSGGYQFSKHELAVEELLQEELNKFEIKSSLKGTKREAVFNSGEWLELPNNHYVLQPCGSNGNPDFIIKYNNKLFYIECKSSKSGMPVWNAHMPKPDWIYIITEKKSNQTVLIKGEDLVPRRVHELRKEFTKLMKNFEKKIENELGFHGQDNTFGFSMFNRVTVKQTKGNTNHITNIFNRSYEEKMYFTNKVINLFI